MPEQTMVSLASNWLKGTWLTYNWQNAGTVTKQRTHTVDSTYRASSPSSRGYPGGLADAQWPTLQNNINDYQASWSRSDNHERSYLLQCTDNRTE